MLFPSCIIISHVGPSVWLPACEVSGNHTALSRLNALTDLIGGLGHLDLLFIHGHRREAGKYDQIVNCGFTIHGTSRSMGFVFLLAFLKGQLGRAILPSSGEYSAPPTNVTRMLSLYSSQWYLPHEMALRMSLYNIAQPVGAMLSGAMQGALSTNLEGVLGRTGWRWAFIINVSHPTVISHDNDEF